MGIQSGKDQRLRVAGGGSAGGTASLLSGDQARDRQRAAHFQDKLMTEDRQAHQLDAMGMQQDFRRENDQANLQRQQEMYRMKTSAEKQYIQDRSNEYQQKRKQIEDAYAGGEGQLTSRQYDDAMGRLQKSYARGDVDVTDPYFSQVEKADQESSWTAPDGSNIPMPTKDGVPQPFEAYKVWSANQGKQMKEQERMQKEKLKVIDERIKAELYDKEIDPGSMRAFEYRERRRKELMDEQVGEPAQGEMGSSGVFPVGSADPFRPAPQPTTTADHIQQQELAPAGAGPSGNLQTPDPSIYERGITVEDIDKGVRPGWVYKDYGTGKVIYPEAVAKSIEKKPVKAADIKPSGDVKPGTNYGQLAGFLLMGDKFGENQAERDGFRFLYESYGEALRNKNAAQETKDYRELKRIIDMKLKENPGIFAEELKGLEIQKEKTAQMKNKGQKVFRDPGQLSDGARKAIRDRERKIANRMKNLNDSEKELIKTKPEIVRARVEEEIDREMKRKNKRKS